MELLKDGRSFYEWMLDYFWNYNNFSTPGYSATPHNTGKYQCKLTIGAASRYSSPSYLAVAGKFEFYSNMHDSKKCFRRIKTA
jgi:hypothetical protein